MLWNRGPAEASITASWSNIGLNQSAVVDAHDLWTVSTLSNHTSLLVKTTKHSLICIQNCSSARFSAYDFLCLQDEVTSSMHGNLTTKMDSHACKMYVLTPK